MVWQQVYDPFHSMFLSALVAAIPVAVMLVGLGFLHLKAHIAAGAGLAAAAAIAILGFGMPADMAAKAAVLGGLTGLMPIGWIVLNIFFLHQLTDQNGSYQDTAGFDRGNHGRSTFATASDRLRFRRVL